MRNPLKINRLKPQTRWERLKEVVRRKIAIHRRRFSDFIWAIKHRTFWKYNVIKIRSLEPGYYDTDTRLFHGVFTLLEDFVEIEKASHHQIGSKNKKLPSREEGLAYLDWEISLNDPYGQSDAAREQKELYLWWKDVYPNRPDPMDESGWSDFCDSHRDKMFILNQQEDGNYLMSDTLSAEEKDEEKKVLDRLVELEQRNNAEDEEMLIRLIKIRRSLWT